jgi:molecular chaperone IbpA
MTITNTLNSLPRSFAVGFDSIFDRLESREKASYPPHNIVKHNEDEFEIALAVAGFSDKDLSVKQDGDQLIVESDCVELNGDKEYLHKGIATRSFIKKFTLADHIRVEQVALVDGILSVLLKKEIPEEMKPKKFTILPEFINED